MRLGILVWVLAISLALGAAFASRFSPAAQPEWPDHNAPEWADMKIYYIKYGTVACAEISGGACGITLRKCTDGRQYYCMQDVAMKDVK